MATSGRNSGPSLTRNNLRDAVYKQFPQLTRDGAKRIINEVFEEIMLSLIESDNVRLRGFGNFKVQHKKERSGRNPKSGVDAVITARRSVKFLASPLLKAKVNGEDVNNLEDDAE